MADRQLLEDHLHAPVAEHIQPGAVTLRPWQTAEQVLGSLRGRDIVGQIVYFYVTDENGVLVGVVPTRKLLMAEAGDRVDSMMVRSLVVVTRDTTVLDACHVFLERRLLALPVVDPQGRLLGTLDLDQFTDELVDVGEQHRTHDVFQLIGIHVDQGRRVSPLSAFLDRFPWLGFNMLGGMACALVLARYEAFLDAAVVLALFIPLVLTLSESVSIQSLTLTLQSLHAPSFGRRRFLRALGQELATALLLGVASGTVVGLVAWLWRDAGTIGVAIGLAIAAAMVTACLLGVLLPVAVHRLRLDPRVAAGPMVLAATDIAATLFYLNLAALLLER